MKIKFIIPTLLLIATLLLINPSQTDANFKDVHADTEQGKAIQSLVDRNIVSGYDDGTFRPSNPVTRGQIAKILAGALNLDTENVTNPNFSDVPTTHPNYKYIAALENAGIINGSKGKYNPNNPVTRGQVAKILTIAYELEILGGDAPFTDIKGHEFELYIWALYSNNITTGVTPTTYGVYQPVTRGQLAVFIKRIENLYPGSATLTKNELGFMNHFVDRTFDETESIVVTKYNYVTDTLTIIPKGVGTTYLNVGEYEEYVIDNSSVKTFQVDVFNGENGLEVKITKLEEVKYIPIKFNVHYWADEIFITDINNNKIDPSLYSIKKLNNEDGDMISEVNIIGGERNYIIHYVNDSGGVEQKHALKVIDNPIHPTIDIGYYVEGDTFNLSNSIIEKWIGKNIISVTSLDETLFDITKVENGLQLKIKNSGIGYFKYTTENGENEIFLRIEPFGNGYLVETIGFYFIH